MKWYISGKISGLPTDQVTAKFKQAEQQIRAFGHEPVNPTNNGLGSEASWNEHLVADRGEYPRGVRLADRSPAGICDL